jgi:predicted amidohydrolase YtcJ
MAALTAAGLLAGCGDAGPTYSGPPADLVLRDGRIVTVDAGRTEAEALCVLGRDLVYVGSSAGAEGCVGPDTEVVELEGRLVLPGFIDSHAHVLGGSISEVGVNLSLADTPELLREALAEILALNPGDGVIYARGWQNHLFPSEGPRRELLDSVFGDRPVILGSVDGHSTWFSSGALAAAGVDSSIDDPDPGVSFWERDPETGRLLGTAREGAGGVVSRALLSREPEDYRRAFLNWLPRAAASGLTGAFDAGMGAPSGEDAYVLLSDLASSGDLTLRVFTSVPVSYEDPSARLKAVRDQYGSDFLVPVAIKLMADGVPEGHTAFMLSEYIDRPGFRGEPMMTPDELAAQVTAAEEAGESVHIHAIGSAAVRMALDAIEEAREAVPGDGPRHGIAHMDFVTREDIPRFAQLDVVAQTSIQWATRDPSYDNIGSFVGMDVVEDAYPVRSLIEAGAIQTFGTDWPAAAYLSTYEPLIQLEVAVTRQLPGRSENPVRSPGERLDVMEAVRSLTIQTARQVGADEWLGSLEVGKRADLIVLARDLFEIDPYEIHTTAVDLTLVDGRVVHRR